MPPCRALALSLLVAALPAQSERTPEGFQLAVGLQQRGLHEEAAQQFERFVAAHGAHPLAAEASYRLGQCRQELQQASAAVAALQQALERGGASFALRPECRYRLGNLLEQQQDRRGALLQFEALAAEIDAQHYLLAAAHYAAGEAWRELGEDGKAAVAFAAAADAATGDRASFRFGALYQLGFTQLRREAWAEAAATFATATTAAPDDGAKGECFHQSGDALRRLEEWDAAERAFGRAVKLGGEFADDAALGLAFTALGRGDRQAALRAFATVCERFPDSPLVATARLERGRALYQEQQAAAAQQELTPLLADGVPPAVQQAARELLGLCALATGAGEAAVASLQQALASAAPADRARLAFALGEALATVQRWDEALAAYALVPDDAPAALRGEALYGACFVLHAAGRHQDSIAKATAVLQLTPAHRLAGEAQLALAENHFALQDYAAAATAFAAVQAPALAAAAAWKLAWCSYLRGDRADAAQRFAAIANGTESAEQEEALAMQALALLEAGDAAAALVAADRYRARYRDGAFVDRTERVAARVLRQQGDLRGAQQRLARAAEVAVQRGGAAAASDDQVEQAELAYQQGDYRAAAAAFATLAGRADAVGARALAGCAWCAFELGDDPATLAAIAAAKAHPAVQGELAGLLELESAVAHRRADWALAIAAASAFLQQFPQHEKATALRFSLGTAQLRSGDAAAARTTLQEVLAAGGGARPDRVAYELGWAARQAGDEPAALAAFRRASESPEVELAGEAKLHLGLAALEQKDLTAATAWLSAVQGSQRGRALYRLGFACFEAAGDEVARLQQAREHFAAVVGIDGEALVGEARYMLGECSRRLGDHAGAIAALQPLLQLAPPHPRAERARLVLGECALAIGDDATVVATLQPLLQASLERADAARVQLWLGRARARRGEHEAAEAALAKATELSDGALAAEAQFRLGEGREARGDLRGACDAYVKLPILYADPTWVPAGLLQAGLCYERLQQPDKAQRFFRELVEKHPNHPAAATARQHLRAN